jgi:hypothetical protein
VSEKCTIYQGTSYGPYFYDGFLIGDKCDKNQFSSSNLGGGFENHGDKFALLGSEDFVVSEYGVFRIEFI